MATQTLSAKELAQKCGTDARTVRKFLRKHLPVDKQPGQGGRYNFTSAEATKLVKAFQQWAKGEKVATPTKAAAATKTAPSKKQGKKNKVANKVDVEDDEVMEIDLSDLEGPGGDEDTESEDEENSDEGDTDE